MKQSTVDHIKRELAIISELAKKGTLDDYTCADISKMAEERSESK